VRNLAEQNRRELTTLANGFAADIQKNMSFLKKLQAAYQPMQAQTPGKQGSETVVFGTGLQANNLAHEKALGRLYNILDEAGFTQQIRSGLSPKGRTLLNQLEQEANDHNPQTKAARTILINALKEQASDAWSYAERLRDRHKIGLTRIKELQEALRKEESPEKKADIRKGIENQISKNMNLLDTATKMESQARKLRAEAQQTSSKRSVEELAEAREAVYREHQEAVRTYDPGTMEMSTGKFGAYRQNNEGTETPEEKQLREGLEAASRPDDPAGKVFREQMRQSLIASYRQFAARATRKEGLEKLPQRRIEEVIDRLLEANRQRPMTFSEIPLGHIEWLAAGAAIQSVKALGKEEVTTKYIRYSDAIINQAKNYLRTDEGKARLQEKYAEGVGILSGGPIDSNRQESKHVSGRNEEQEKAIQAAYGREALARQLASLPPEMRGQYENSVIMGEEWHPTGMSWLSLQTPASLKALFGGGKTPMDTGVWGEVEKAQSLDQLAEAVAKAERLFGAGRTLDKAVHPMLQALANLASSRANLLVPMMEEATMGELAGADWQRGRRLDLRSGESIPEDPLPFPELAGLGTEFMGPPKPWDLTASPDIQAEEMPPRDIHPVYAAALERARQQTGMDMGGVSGTRVTAKPDQGSLRGKASPIAEERGTFIEASPFVELPEELPMIDKPTPWLNKPKPKP
jgi:hypothetical protein